MDVSVQQEVMGFLQQGDINHAKSIMETICNLDCKDPAAWLLLASTYAACGDFEGTCNCCKKSLEFDASNFSANYNYAIALENLNNIEQAIKQYGKVATLFPNYIDTYLKLGNLHCKSSNYTVAYGCYKNSLAINAEHIGSLIGLGNTLLEMNRSSEAIDCYLKALKLSPDLFEANFNLATAYYKIGKSNLSIPLFKKIINEYPDIATTYNSLGAALVENNDFENAILAYKKAIKFPGTATSAYTNLGNVYNQMGLFNKARECYEKSIEINPNNEPALYNMGNLYIALGDLIKAENAIDKAIALSPDKTDSIVGKAVILEKKGNIKDANFLLQPLFEKGVKSTSFLLTYALLEVTRSESEIKKIINLLETAAADNHRLLKERTSIHYALGYLYDARSEYDNAFKNYQIANDHSSVPVNMDDHFLYVNNIISTFKNIGSFHKVTENQSDSSPIFIVGMPRSGTSLVEQILSTNDEVHAGGELLLISELIDSIPEKYINTGHYPQCFGHPDQSQLVELSAFYTRAISDLSGSVKYVTDKMPINYFHLGMISLLFPSAKIIHCSRDPVDTCLSCFFTNMIGYPHFKNMATLGKYYKSYSTLMDFWNSTLEIPMLDVCYETLVTDPETVTKNLMKFCGLEWNISCLEFYNNKHITHTASYNQVRKPIYTRSVRRREKYAKHINKLLQALD